MDIPRGKPPKKQIKFGSSIIINNCKFQTLYPCWATVHELFDDFADSIQFYA